MRVHIRWMIRRDMEEVLEIEKQGSSCPWTEEEFVHRLRERNCIGMVAEYKQEVIGFVIYVLHKKRIVILNMAVSWYHLRNGVGRQLVTHLTKKLGAMRRTHLSLVVSDENLDAHLFFKAMGFRATHTEVDWFESTNASRDGYNFEYWHHECKPTSVEV